jgi:hypothetical protein
MRTPANPLNDETFKHWSIREMGMFRQLCGTSVWPVEPQVSTSQGFAGEVDSGLFQSFDVIRC